MKKISFVVPCYNSQDYMERCIDSLLVGGEDVEILIVNDGSTDNTKKIANRYQKKYPTIVKAIHKENGGHGSGVNVGLEHACGKYFKVVDSDDWLEKEALLQLLKKIKQNKKEVDLIICNYVYNHLYENKKRVVRYNNVFPKNVICTWEDMKHFNKSQYLIMHSLLYKTAILKRSKIQLPLHTFYVDNIVAYQPLPFVKSICYYDLDLYQYFIGRSDQSVNEKVMVQRVDQQLKVTNIILHCTNLEKVKESSYRLYEYMVRMVSMMITISSVYLVMKGDQDSYQKRKKMWDEVKQVDKSLYKKLRFSKLAGITYMIPGKVGGFITLKGYKLAQKIYRFN